MKKTILAALISMLGLSGICFAQEGDIIVKRDGEKIHCKVLEIGLTEIKYRKRDNPDGPIYGIFKTDVQMIEYENGTKNIFDAEGKLVENNVPTLSKAAYFQQGMIDASKNYRGYKEAGTATLAASILSPFIGLGAAIGCSSTTPKKYNLNYPDNELIKNPDYFAGYVKRAKKIKQRKVWQNWGIALGAYVLVFIAINQ